MDPLLGLLLLFGLSRWGGAGKPAPGGGLFPSPRPGKPADKGGGGASAFPVTPPPRSVPPRSGGGNWKPYPAPIPAAVVARAHQLLRDKSMVINAERIEPDPAGSGNVRYWKVNQPPGKLSVTAWKPSLAQARPAGNPPPGQHVLRSALTTTRPGAKAPTGRSKQFPGRAGPRGAGGGPGFARGAGGGPSY